MSVVSSPEMYINMKKGDIPKWNELYTYDDQDEDVKQFWAEEALKLTDGITINGVFIHPWLYWHLNFWHMMLDKDGKRIPGLSQLRDNEWMFAEFLKQSEEENKGIFMFGTRRFGKALMNSEILYMADREIEIGEVSPGDMIYDDKGELVEVEEVFPQGKIQLYKVEFDDGRSSICCANHIWKVKMKGSWSDRTLRNIMMEDYTKISIPLCEPVKYDGGNPPFSPSMYGSLISNYLQGNIVEIPFNKRICKAFTRVSVRQKRAFIEAFIKAAIGIETGNDYVPVVNKDREVIAFVQRMIWSYGWYAKFDGAGIIISQFIKEVPIKSISVYGRHEATCIRVKNLSHLFLTTNYVVTHNTAIMSSLLARNATMTYNLAHNVIGSSKEDLSMMGEYLEFGLDNMHPFLRINRTGNDWAKEVTLGTKTIGNVRDVHARIRIINIDAGKTGASLKTAGGTPYTSIYDEVGKFPVLGAYLAGKPAHMAHGKLRGNVILSGTGGNIERSQDAQKIMNSPEEYGFITMNYDLINSRAIKPTWRICKSGCFVPAQMSHAFGKDKTNLADYLGMPEAEDLKSIKMLASDFEKNTKILEDRLDELAKKNDRSLFVQERMAYPRSIDDCFLNTTVNRFPIEDALIHKSRILEEGRKGKLVDIYQGEGGRLHWNYSDKLLATYPFKGGNHDAPVVIYEDPPEKGKDYNYTYVSGLDIYKSDKADTDSLGAFYVFKRYVNINDPYAMKLVASYASRPAISDDFCRTCEALIEGYGAKCLMENADRMFEFYLKRRNKELILLEDGEKLSNKLIKPGARQNNKLGLSPTVQNQRMIINAVLQYCWEEVVVGYDDDGEEITQKGIYRIEDVELLDEIIAFGPGVNTDRIIAFGHALLLARYYDEMNFMPKSRTQQMNDDRRENRRAAQVRHGMILKKKSPYAVNPYRRIG